MRIRVWVQVQVRVQCGDSAIFEKVRCGCGEIRLLKNYKIYFYLYFAKHIFLYNGKQMPI